MHQSLDKMMKRGREFLNCQYPIICGAMTWVSEPGLVAAVCNAGAFACLAGGNTPPEILRQQIEETKKLTDKPFGVNLITVAPAYHQHLKMLPELNLDYVIFAGSFPRDSEVKTAKDSGAKVMCFASTVSIAKRMMRFGADAIILEGSEAGGHIGHVSAMVLLQQILMEERNDIPIFVAGGIANGKMLAHVMMMGATGVQMGTRFVMTDECHVHDNFKNSFKRSNARDAISTPQYDSKLPVVAVRALRNKGMDQFGALQLELLEQLNAGEIHREEAQIKVEEYWMGALRRAAIDGDIDFGSLMAGQSVGLVDKVMPVKALIAELIDDASAEIELVSKMIN
jgi:enoyl-[acyl-carrier protein] reductase II